MVNAEFFCRHFKLTRENCDLDINFTLSICHKHERKKTII